MFAANLDALALTSAFILLDRRAAGVLHRACFRFAFQYFVWQHAPVGFDIKAVSSTVTEEKTELILPSRIEAIAEAAAVAAEIAGRLGLSEEAAFGLDMAMREAVTNAVLHGNKQDETKKVEITFQNTGAGLVVTVRDQGMGFDPASIPDPTTEQNLLKTSGRGILFMRTFMDDVQWERHPGGGTVVRMTKRL
jgi:serine/threonine-protein kinase RsbW